jgi:hypothetical protein
MHKPSLLACLLALGACAAAHAEGNRPAASTPATGIVKTSNETASSKLLKTSRTLNQCLRFVPATGTDGVAYIENQCGTDAVVNFCYLPQSGASSPDASCEEGAGNGGSLASGTRMRIVDDHRHDGIVIFGCPDGFDVDLGIGPGKVGEAITRSTRSSCTDVRS